MRKLTIKRRKAFAACISKLKIYIEDVNDDTNINGTKCRLLGELKNNEAATYEIGNESCRLFAIYDKASMMYCNDIYQIPEGEEDLEISGKAKLNPFMGNPFIFDNNENKEALQNRQQNKKKSLVMNVLWLVFGVVLCALIIGGAFLLGSLL